MSTTNRQFGRPMVALWRSPLFWRLFSGPLVALLLLAIIGGAGLTRIAAVLDSSRVVQQTGEMHDLIGRFIAQLRVIRTSTIQLSRAGYDLPQFAQREAELTQLRAALTTTNVPAAEHSTVAAMLALFDKLHTEIRLIIDLAGHDPAAAQARWQGGAPSDAQQLDQVIADNNRIFADLDQLRARYFGEIQDTQNAALIVFPTVILAGLLLSLLLTLRTLHQAVRQITALGRDLEQLAAGDLRLPARLARLAGSGAGRDEVAALERSYARAVEKLRAPIHQIQQDVGRISTAAADIRSASTDQATTSGEQAGTIGEVTVTVEQLNQTAVQIAEAAAGVAAAAEQALLSAGHGQEAVRDSIIGMAMIRSRVNDITARILALSAQSQRISEIIDLIDTMAGQTHILALNAAVESAGAGGEVGERFGVVASEVKKLAQRSAAATREVRAVIAQVQAATNAAVMATEDGLKETEKGVGLAHQSGDANEDIIGMVERTAQLANAINLATQQQRTASEQVVATMHEIAAGTRRTAGSSLQAAHAAGDMSDIAGELRTVSDGFVAAETPTASLRQAG